MLISAVYPLACYFVFIAACGVLGAAAVMALARFLDRGPPRMPNPETAFFVYVGTGIAVTISGLFVLASIGALEPWSVGTAGVMGLVLAAAVLARNGAHLRDVLGLPRGRSRDWVWVLPLLIYGAGVLLGALRPPLAWDELSYHLPYARDYLEAGGLTVSEYLRYPLHSHNFNLLYALALMVADERLAHLMHGGSAVLIALGLFGLARSYLGAGSAALAVFFLFSFDGFRNITATAHVDLGLALFVSLAAFSLVYWHTNGQRYWLYVAAIALGMGMGTKYIGGAFAPLFALWVLVRSRSPRETLYFCSAVAAFGVWWYVRSYLISGNPLHPFAGQLFGYYLWDAQDLIDQHGDLASHAPATGPLAPFVAALQVTLGERPELSVFALPFFVAPVIFRRLPASLSVLCSVSMAYYLFWAWVLGPARYLMPIMPAIALFSSAVVSTGAQAIAAHPRMRPTLEWSRRRQPRVRTILVALVSLIAARETIEIARRVPEWPWTPEEQGAYLAQRLPGFDLIQAANESGEINGGRLYLMGFGNLTYWYRGEALGDYFGIARYRPLYTRDGLSGQTTLDPEKLEQLADRFQLAAVLVETGAFPQLDRAAWSERFRLLAESDYGTLWLVNGRSHE